MNILVSNCSLWLGIVVLIMSITAVLNLCTSTGSQPLSGSNAAFGSEILCQYFLILSFTFYALLLCAISIVLMAAESVGTAAWSQLTS